MVNWQNGNANYMQWKPVVYLSTDRTLKSSTDVSARENAHLDDVSNFVLNTSLAWVWFGKDIYIGNGYKRDVTDLDSLMSRVAD